MKKIFDNSVRIAIITGLFIVGFFTQSSGQEAGFKIPQSRLEAETPQYKLESFSARELNGKLYFKITVVNDTTDGFFSLEKSVDGTNFVPVDAARNIPSRVGIPILYCFSDDIAASLGVKYRMIKYTAADRHYLADYNFTPAPDVLPVEVYDPGQTLAESLPGEE